MFIKCLPACQVTVPSILYESVSFILTTALKTGTVVIPILQKREAKMCPRSRRNWWVVDLGLPRRQSHSTNHILLCARREREVPALH